MNMNECFISKPYEFLKILQRVGRWSLASIVPTLDVQ